MKTITTLLRRITLPVLALATIALLPSCVIEEQRGYYRRPTAVISTPGFYASLPGSYRGEYYQHDGRYYYGGRHEQGHYRYNGRIYDQRYNHNGQYYYGGQYNGGRY